MNLIKVRVSENSKSMWSGQELSFFVDRLPYITVGAPDYGNYQGLSGLSGPLPYPLKQHNSITIRDVDDDLFAKSMMDIARSTAVFDFKLFINVEKYDPDIAISMAMRLVYEGGKADMDLENCMIVKYNTSYTADEFSYEITFTDGVFGDGVNIF